jgi:hypothetical protein
MTQPRIFSGSFRLSLNPWANILSDAQRIAFEARINDNNTGSTCFGSEWIRDGMGGRLLKGLI